jgi:NTE family protein
MKKSIKLVSGGSGAFLSVQAGAITAIEDNFLISDLTGTSSGSVNNALIAFGYSKTEREGILFNLNLNDYLDRYLTAPLSLFLNNHLSIYEGKKIYELFKKLFSKNGIPITFGQLQIPLTVVTTDINKKEPLIFSTKTTPNQELAIILRASMSLPSVFTPVDLNNKKLVDGGLTKNLFIDNYHNEDKDIIAVRVFDNNDFDTVKDFKSLMVSSFFTSLLANEKDSLKFNPNAKFIKLISDFDILNFSKLTKEVIKNQYLEGYKKTFDIIKNDF